MHSLKPKAVKDTAVILENRLAVPLNSGMSDSQWYQLFEIFMISLKNPFLLVVSL